METCEALKESMRELVATRVDTKSNSDPISDLNDLKSLNYSPHRT